MDFKNCDGAKFLEEYGYLHAVRCPERIKLKGTFGSTILIVTGGLQNSLLDR
jgi:hypothetical protein